jgi:hypothetical protein
MHDTNSGKEPVSQSRRGTAAPIRLDVFASQLGTIIGGWLADESLPITADRQTPDATEPPVSGVQNL